MLYWIVPLNFKFSSDRNTRSTVFLNRLRRSQRFGTWRWNSGGKKCSAKGFQRPEYSPHSSGWPREGHNPLAHLPSVKGTRQTGSPSKSQRLCSRQLDFLLSLHSQRGTCVVDLSLSGHHAFVSVSFPLKVYTNFIFTWVVPKRHVPYRQPSTYHGWM